MLVGRPKEGEGENKLSNNKNDHGEKTLKTPSSLTPFQSRLLNSFAHIFSSIAKHSLIYFMVHSQSYPRNISAISVANKEVQISVQYTFSFQKLHLVIGHCISTSASSSSSHRGSKYNLHRESSCLCPLNICGCFGSPDCA